MRDSFVNAVTELAGENDRFILLSADLGFGIFDDYREKFPDRFLNVGVSEQNMIGVATGMALEGWTVFAYSIGNFSTLRCLEQIRNDAAYHEANVNIVTSGGGFTYGQLGMSHHATEDISIMRALPGVTTIVPADAYESGEAVKALAAMPGVGYLRIEKNVPLDSKEAGGPFVAGRARRIHEGENIALICAGGITCEAMQVAERLDKQGYSARVVSMHTLKPLDEREIRACMDEIGCILSIEENTINGGLGSAVAEVLAEAGFSGRFRRMGMKDVYSSVVGDQDFLRQQYDLGADAIEENALALIQSNKRAGSEV